MNDANPSAHDLDFLDEKHADFKGVRDNVARGLRNAGIGATVNHTNIIILLVKKKTYSGLLIYLECLLRES